MYTIGVVGIHLLALLALVPWLFSWTGVTLAVLGHFVFGMFGVTIGYHRLLAHQAFSCPKWLEHFFSILGVCCMQDTPARWVAIHRMHHQDSDEQSDPHSPLVNFFWGHMGWLLVENRDHDNIMVWERYSRDLLRDRFYLRLERNLLGIRIYAAHAVLYYLVGLAIGWAATAEFLAGVQFGLSLLVWGVFVRTVLVWHITWSVNSLTHVWGYRNYETNDNSRNNWFVGFLSNGEGWHNNHHADQRCAAHGRKWWEFDLTYLMIRLLERAGLARNVVEPQPRSVPKRNAA